MSFGGQGARREAGSEGYAEKYRAVVDEGYLKDELVGRRWDKVEPALWGRRHSHSPTAPRCLRTARKRRIAGSRSAVWRFFARRNISFKKNSVRGGAEACGRSPRTPALDARARH